MFSRIRRLLGIASSAVLRTFEDDYELIRRDALGEPTPSTTTDPSPTSSPLTEPSSSYTPASEAAESGSYSTPTTPLRYSTELQQGGEAYAEHLRQRYGIAQAFATE